MARPIPPRLDQALRGIGAQESRAPSGPVPDRDVSVSLPAPWDLVCYDTETTDKHTNFAQILQFAGLLVDRDYNVAQSRNLTVRLLPEVVPSPGALRVNGVDHRSLDDEDRHDEYDAAVALAALMKPPQGGQRVYLTFNGPSFDDEIIRRTLYRNLQPCYFTRNSDCRIDVLNLARLVACAPDAGLRVRRTEDGSRLDFRLTALCEANDIDLTNAHDALGDSRATLALANLIRGIAPWAWNIAFACGIAEVACARADAAKASGKPLWLFDPTGGLRDDAFVPCSVVGRTKNNVTLANLHVLHMEALPNPLPGAGELYYCDGKVRDGKTRDAEGHDIRPVSVARVNKPVYLLTSDEVRHFVTDDAIRVMDDAAMRFSKRTEDIAILDRHSQTPNEWKTGDTPEENIYDFRIDNENRERALIGRFNSVARWADALPVAMDLGDWRHRDFAARILLRMCTEGEIEGMGPGAAAELRRRAADSLARPFGRPAEDGKGWMTLAQALEDEMATPDMRDWLRARYVDPSAPAADEEPECGPGPGMPGR